MKGLYLYCLRKKKTPLSVVKTPLSVVKTPLSVVKTIDEGEAYTVPYKELEAVVSPVDLEKFSSEKIQKKAQQDVNWIKEKAQIHEYVIEQAMVKDRKIIPVIPMKFGTIFKTEKSLAHTLKKNYSKFKKTLENLEGKQEWGVKVYLNEDIFENQLKKSKAVQKKQKGIASLPKGMDFFVKKQIEEVIKKEKNRKLEKIIQQVFENLQKFAIEANQGKNLDKAITGREEAMVLNASFLVKEEKVREFQNQVEGLKAKHQRLGLIIQESGPWPPYNFL